ncbi:MAG TPA: hypothetical protein VMS40_12050 [Vicinamibacterales bacterium]|nr:hypothetical protein [Vicinamibacterales bacterium]
MASTWKTSADSLVSDLRNVFGTRLLAVVAYGRQIEGISDVPLTCLALVSSLSAEDLQACAQFARRWNRAHIATPLILPSQEFMRSLDTFPLEYGEIIRSHELVYGENPFSSATIAADDMRRACELQAKSHLVHLREAFIESGGKPTDVAELVTSSAPAFTQLLRNVARLNRVTTDDRSEVTRAGARAVGIPEELVADMLNLERRSGVPATDPSRLFPEYLAAVEQLARAVDGWRA